MIVGRNAELPRPPNFNTLHPLRVMTPILLALLLTPRTDLLGEAFQGVAFGDSVAVVERKLEGLADELRRVEVASPYLPLAAKTQTHLIAVGLGPVGVEEAAFTFGDDRLVQVEVRGGGVEGLLPAVEEEGTTFLGYDVRLRARLVADRERDVLWMLSEEAMHPNLFLWTNPDLPSFEGPVAPYDTSATAPDFLAFGGELETLQARMQSACARTWSEETRPPWLPTKPRKQVQIDSLGYVYAGFPRKIEAVFGDGRLQLAWILTGKQEEARVREALIARHGPPVHVGKNWEVFAGWRVARRKDKPEVLLLAEELVPAYREQILADG